MAPYRAIKNQENEIYSTLTQDVGNITQVSLLIIEFVTSVVLIVACLFYMAYLSIPMFLVSFGVIVLAILFYEFLSKKSVKRFNRARDLEANFMQSFNSILHGSKEINLDRSKGLGIYDLKSKVTADEALDNNQKAYVGFLNSQLVGQVAFYVLIVFILLYAGSILGVSVGVVISFTFILLYILGPIGNVTSIIPFVSRAAISLRKMKQLEHDVENMVEQIIEKVVPMARFESLNYRDVQFSYGEDTFGVGPINFEITKGRIIFIYGGNGSGKTTFMNTLLFLYAPTSGTIFFNQEELKKENISAFKKLFGVVFSDFHLFDQFYGLESLDQEKAKEYLELFEISEKVTVTENGFSTIDLSSGQRKRLALIATLLENKPILVLDEWAADQDPHFRKKFYQTILPTLKAEGITIIAITHDDNYYHCSDSIYRMEYGKLKEVNN